MIVGTAGHIDHGKSTLVEALTGQTMDRLADEQRRGITIGRLRKGRHPCPDPNSPAMGSGQEGQPFEKLRSTADGHPPCSLPAGGGRAP